MIWTTLTDPLPIIGRMQVVGSAGKIIACAFGDVPQPSGVRRLLAGSDVVEDATAAAPLAEQLEQYLTGRRRDFDIGLDLRLLSEFQATVLTTLRHEIGYGHTTSYAALAEAVGRPTAVRAVGRALATNPLCLLLPCHRVIASSGTLTGYAGGLSRKAQLLELEAQQPIS